jgi:hypothetical protein
MLERVPITSIVVYLQQDKTRRRTMVKDCHAKTKESSFFLFFIFFKKRKKRKKNGTKLMSVSWLERSR